MQCLYCRATNDHSEERCTRCGRRLHAANPRPAPDTFPLATATAPALEALPGGAPVTFAARVVETPDPQTSLFREPINPQKVVPIPTLTPLRVPDHPVRRPRNSSQRAPRGSRRSSDYQQTLEFREPPA